MRLINPREDDAVAPDYRDMDQPAYIRHKRAAVGGAAIEQSGGDLDYLDIPAFLRRQAD
jgi:cell division protein FtsZ